ncbi:hypothetical protein ASG87_02910 [Frateuria sp. Soil773]|uniref:hypothetical protein n=1 Tax=Frateuria sp. Soil773 TaxID=1736407 RepID=UPI0006F3FC1B|nr:hypothetical protein [Frateuria sp. Soil773]KRE89309.1 hypothetical protein ASG87_02910 [Frateuria sp. Soil773]
MTRQLVIVLDNPPLEHDRWADEVFAQARFAPISNAEVAARMGQDAATREVLLQHADDPMADAEVLAPYYRRAFEQLYGDVQRAGVFGTAWLVYAGEVDACVIDWSEVERLAGAPGVPADDGEQFRRRSKDFVHERTRKYLKPGRLLELEPGLSHEEKVSRTLAFLKQLGLC